MDPDSIMENTEQTGFGLQTDRRTDKVKPVYPLNFVGGGAIMPILNTLSGCLLARNQQNYQ